MSGYVREPKVYRLRFEDEEMAGLIVRARSTTLGAFLDVAGLVGMDVTRATQEDLRKLTDLFATFEGALIDWNLEEPEGVPVPTTQEGIQSQPVDFIMRIIAAWIEAISDVPGPLEAGSSAGRPSVPPSIPMEVLPASQAS